MTNNPTIKPRKEFVRQFESLRGRYYASTIWNDFIAGAAWSFAEVACSISPLTTTALREAVAKGYDHLKRSYTDEERDTFSKMLAYLIMEYEANPWQDLLGSLWSELEVNSQSDKQHKGQFFTPYHVSAAMAQVGMTGMGDVIDRKGFVTLLEPAAGAGGMIIAAAKVLFDEGYNPQKQMHVTAQDVDLNCVYMSYIQLSMLGIPGVVIHGDTLADTQNSIWPTFNHYLGFWNSRLKRHFAEQGHAEPEAVNPAPAEVAPPFVIDPTAAQLGFIFEEALA